MHNVRQLMQLLAQPFDVIPSITDRPQPKPKPKPPKRTVLQTIMYTLSLRAEPQPLIGMDKDKDVDMWDMKCQREQCLLYCTAVK